MKNTTIFLKIGLILLLFIVILMDAFLFPYLLTFSQTLDSTDVVYDFKYYIQLSFFLISSIPFIIIIIWFLVLSIKNNIDKVIIQKIKNCAYILYVDSFIFLIAQIYFYAFLNNLFALYFIIFPFLGFVSGTVCYIFYSVLNKKIELEQ